MTKTFTLARTASFALIAAGMLSVGCVAHAASEDQAPQGELNTAGTDFTSSVSVNHLISRLHRVVDDICAPYSSSRATLTDDERTCVTTALKDGLAQISIKQQLAARATLNNMASASPAAIRVH